MTSGVLGRTGQRALTICAVVVSKIEAHAAGAIRSVGAYNINSEVAGTPNAS